MSMTLGTAKPGATAFEIKLYRNPDDGGQGWAGLTSRVVHAANAAEARRLALQHYPAEQGYIISAICAVTLQ